MSSPRIASNCPAIQPRDLEILRSLLDSRVAKARQLAALHFSGKREAAKKRLQALKRCGFIAARRRRPQEPAVLFLTRTGIRLLKDRGLLLDCSPKRLTSFERISRAPASIILRELEVLDVRISIMTALPGLPSLRLVRFTASPDIPQGKASASRRPGNTPWIRPDAFMEIDEESPGERGSRSRLYVQLDRPDESLDVLVSRARAYSTHVRSGDFARFLEEPPKRYRDFPVRVLYVFKSRERQNIFAQLLLAQSPPILTQAWLTTFVELLSDPFGPIWLCPIDYRPSAVSVPSGIPRTDDSRPKRELIPKQPSSTNPVVL